MQKSDLPMADPVREATAKRIFHEYLMMSPSEWVARFAHTIGTSSFADYRYADMELQGWLHELHRLLRTPGAVEQARQRYLTPSERAQIAQEQDEL
jgi:hypothetical protein